MNNKWAERETELEAIPLLKGNKERWPQGVRPVSIDELDIVGVDKAGRLYWDGEPIKLKRTIELSLLERIVVIVAAAATAGVFVLELGKVVGWWQAS